MKIRIDFVTNSSSSSFIIEVDVKLKDGNIISLDNPENHTDRFENLNGYCECSEETLNITSEDIFNCEDVDDLIQIIEEGILTEMYYNEDDEEEDSFGINARKILIEEFTDKLYEMGDLNNIESIEFRNNYNAWGEFSGCIVENDEILQELTENYFEDDSEENIEALINYLTDANKPSELDEEVYFGSACEKFRYKWYDGDLRENIQLIANAIQCSCGVESGIEYLKVDFANKTYESYAELEIQ